MNPRVALALGAAIVGERVTRVDLAALALVLGAVPMVALGFRAARVTAPAPALARRGGMVDEVSSPG